MVGSAVETMVWSSAASSIASSRAPIGTHRLPAVTGGWAGAPADPGPGPPSGLRSDAAIGSVMASPYPSQLGR